MSDLDLITAHKYFSTACFNACWELIDKDNRTAEDDEHMLHLAFSSHYHWTQRPDYTPTSASVAFWQISRVYTLLAQTENAMRYAELCLQTSSHASVAPFFKAYAYEALARASALAGDADQKDRHLAAARTLAEQIPEPGERDALLADLQTI